MDDAPGVGVFERFGYLAAVSNHLLRTHWRVRRSQCSSLDMLHGDEDKSVLFTDFVDGADVGMVERRSHLGLADQACASRLVASHLGRQDLQNDLAVQPFIPGKISHTHAASPDGFDDVVMAQGAAEHTAS